MTHDTEALLDLIGSRICHDIISPLGAISNGVELMTMNGSPAGPEMNLISESVENANARIRFFRIAFGHAGREQRIGPVEIRSILRDVSRDGRLVTDWQPQSDVGRQQVKLAFLLVQCIESAMPRGGRVTISEVGDQWAIYGEAARMKIDPELWESLSRGGDGAKPDAAHVHFALAPIAARAIGRCLTLEISTNSARVRF